MHDLKYRVWIEKGGFSPATVKLPDNAELHSLTESYLKNIKRVDTLADLPKVLAVGTSIAAVSHVIGQIESKTKNESLTSEGLSRVMGRFSASKTSIEEFKKLALEFIDVGQTTEHPSISMGMDAVLSSIVIIAYGAFESMAIDLWTAAVNLRPKSLVRNVMDAGRSRPKESEETNAILRQEKTISFEILAEYDFDISKVMGLVLRRRGVVRFENFEGIKKAFETTFIDETSKKRCARLHKAFVSDDIIIATQAIRNLFAHNGGAVDERFQTKIKKYWPKMAALPLGAPLELDFEIVRALCGTLFHASLNLIRYVDKWLTDHPE